MISTLRLSTAFMMAITLSFFCHQANTQTTSTFESFGLMPGEYINDVMGEGFTDGNLFFQDNYNPDWFAWSGWAISADTDVETRGFMNQHSSITGGGANESNSYGVFYQFSYNHMLLQGDAQGGYLESCYISNATYTYFSMLEGDGFAKMFGGETGDDPDYLLLTIHGYLNGAMNPDSIDFYLADYRFDDNDMDYILEDWTYLDLQPLGNVDSVTFTLTSTDVGENGMNTPAYFCIDDITTADMMLVGTNDVLVEELEVAPNPTNDEIRLVWPYEEQATAQVYDMNGQILLEFNIQQGSNQLSLEHLPAALYSVVCKTSDKVTVNRIVKQ